MTNNERQRGAQVPDWITTSMNIRQSAMVNRYQDDWLCSVNPYIRYAQYSVLSPHSVVGPRIIYDYEIVYIKSGVADIVINGVCYHATQGDFFFFKPGVEHAMYIQDEPLVQPHIHFDLRYEANSGIVPVNFDKREKMTQEEQERVRPDESGSFFADFPDYMQFNHSLYIEQLFFDVIYSFSLSEPFNELKLKWQFLRMFTYLLNEVNWHQAKHTRLASERAQHIHLYLERNLNRRVTLQELSEVYHLDKSYISRCYREVYNTSPIHSHLLMRFNRAKSMVIYTNLSFSYIAEQNGFASLQDFSRTFRKLEGRPPSALRENLPKELESEPFPEE